MLKTDKNRTFLSHSWVNYIFYIWLDPDRWLLPLTCTEGVGSPTMTSSVHGRAAAARTSSRRCARVAWRTTPPCGCGREGSSSSIRQGHRDVTVNVYELHTGLAIWRCINLFFPPVATWRTAAKEKSAGPSTHFSPLDPNTKREPLKMADRATFDLKQGSE